jgi:hypothetical protein
MHTHREIVSWSTHSSPFRSTTASQKLLTPFLQELESGRKAEYAASEQRLGITREVWAIQKTPMGELFVVFFQALDSAGAVGQFVGSRHTFDLWFKEQVKDTTDVDLNVPPPGAISDILSVYAA